MSDRANDTAGRRAVAEHLRRAADAGFANTAIYLLAALTDNGNRRARNPLAAAELYRKAAEKGCRPAQLRWALSFWRGAISSKTESRVNLGCGAQRLQAIQKQQLWSDLYTQSGPMPPNYSEAANWYKRAADAGHIGAAHALASLYLTGAGVPQDNDEAARWFGIAAEAGNSASQVDLANLTIEGGATSEDPPKIAGWFEKAALVGDLTAAYNLGVCLAQGVGVERDDKQAAVWLRRAADGRAPDPYEARVWFAKAADSGVLDAQVGRCVGLKSIQVWSIRSVELAHRISAPANEISNEPNF